MINLLTSSRIVLKHLPLERLNALTVHSFALSEGLMGHLHRCHRLRYLDVACTFNVPMTSEVVAAPLSGLDVLRARNASPHSISWAARSGCSSIRLRDARWPGRWSSSPSVPETLDMNGVTSFAIRELYLGRLPRMPIFPSLCTLELLARPFEEADATPLQNPHLSAQSLFEAVSNAPVLQHLILYDLFVDDRRSSRGPPAEYALTPTLANQLPAFPRTFRRLTLRTDGGWYDAGTAELRRACEARSVILSCDMVE